MSKTTSSVLPLGLAIRSFERKFEKGAVYSTFDEFLSDCRDSAGSRFVYWNNKLMHVNFAGGMSLNGLTAAIGRGILFRATRKEQEKQ